MDRRFRKLRAKGAIVREIYLNLDCGLYRSSWLERVQGWPVRPISMGLGTKLSFAIWYLGLA